MKRRLFTILSALAPALLTGCAQDGTIPSPSEPYPRLKKAEVIAIAKGAIEEYEDWPHGAEYGEPQQDASGEWSVVGWRIHRYDEHGEPKFVPGGLRLIWIDQRGDVTEYRGIAVPRQ